MKREGVLPRQADRLAKIDAAGQHLLEIINAVLDLSKIEANRLTLEDAPLTLGSIVANVSALVVDRADTRDVRLLTEVQGGTRPLRGDRTRLQQALLNYASNAVKFTKVGSVTLRAAIVHETETPGDDPVLVRFEVQDTGIGLDAAQVERLFTPFEQADNSTTRQYGGTGLGLAINKQLAQLMGGEVGVSSTPGEGSTFWFTARLTRGQAEPAPAKQPGAASFEDTLRTELAGRRILLVEDEPTNREVMIDLLESAAQQVDQAVDGAQAVALGSASRYDLILMDVQMPVLDGLAATRRLRAAGASSNSPIVALTANAFAEDRERCLQAGMNDFIAKPFDVDSLFETVAKWLRA
jgi:CheY-like chemotaxis protein